MTEPSEIRRFIRLIKGIAPCSMGHIFTEGGCYRFYLILKEVFPSAQAYWNKNEDHVITKIAGAYWDIYGSVVDEEEIGRKLSAADHKSASLFHFDEVYFLTRKIRNHMDGKE